MLNGAAGGQSRSEVLHTAEQHEQEGQAQIQHS